MVKKKNNNNKKKNNKPRKVRQPRIKNQVNASTLSNDPKSLASMQASGAKQDLIKSICALSDPFCIHAYGARYPDGASAKSLTEDVVYIAPLNIAAAAGSGGLGYFCPGNNPFYPYLYTTSAPPYATSSSLNAGPNLLSSSGNAFRVTSVGIRFYCTLSANAAAGYLIIGKTNANPFSVTGITSGSTQYEDVKTFPLTHGGEYCVTLRPLGTDTRLYSNVALTNATAYNGVLQFPSFENCVIEIIGAPLSSVVLTAELVIHIEWIPDHAANTLASGYARLTRQPPVENTFLQRASNAVYNAVDSIVKAGVPYVGAAAEMAAARYIGRLPARGARMALMAD